MRVSDFLGRLRASMSIIDEEEHGAADLWGFLAVFAR